jgi:hypothetical protein
LRWCAPEVLGATSKDMAGPRLWVATVGWCIVIYGMNICRLFWLSPLQQGLNW